MLEGFLPCPFCGENDQLTITPKSSYEEVFMENDSATISAVCWSCSLDLYEHTNDNVMDYDTKVELLKKKWNARRNGNA